ncbi:MAG: aspartate kinase [Crocinitomicaceae bacterium]|nr:aspartate kinase [Crocinitomicaceae bacterium]
MIVFKFGGASVKDAKAVKNVANVLSLYSNEKIVVVISAMGKTTNLLEEVVQALWKKDISTFNYYVNEALKYHLGIVDQLFSEPHSGVMNFLDTTFNTLREKSQLPLSENYDLEYDQIVSLGELISTYIVEAYLVDQTFEAAWMDARKLIVTDSSYRNGNVNWDLTTTAINSTVPALFKTSSVVITQGFIGGSSENTTVTLGREGSDYTAAIFAYCLNAESVTIWKDVPGMLNADPKWFDDTVKLNQISFQEAIELAYYGATVIHPKTIKPLQNKSIPLYVKSFIDPTLDGTIISQSTEFDTLVPSFIFKMNQVMFAITPKDFSFIAEENLRQIFDCISSNGVQINMMQNSAISFDFVVDAKPVILDQLTADLSLNYEVNIVQDLELVTIRHYDQPTIERVTVDKHILLTQKSEQTARILMRNKE